MDKNVLQLVLGKWPNHRGSDPAVRIVRLEELFITPAFPLPIVLELDKSSVEPLYEQVSLN